MKHQDLNQKTHQQNDYIAERSASAGPDGTSISPPDYGVEIPDRELDEGLAIGSEDLTASNRKKDSPSDTLDISTAAPQASKKDEEQMVRTWVGQGRTNENLLTNQVFFYRHPQLNPKMQIVSGSAESREWISIRDKLIRPVLRQAQETGNRTHSPGQMDKTRTSTSKPRAARSAVESKTYEHEKGELTRFLNVLQTLKEKVTNFISIAPKETDKSNQPSGRDSAKIPTPASTTLVVQNAGAINDVLQVAMRIEQELKDKYGEDTYARGKWITVTDDPEGIKLATLEKARIGTIERDKNNKIVKYRYYEGGFMGYGEAFIEKSINGKKQRVRTDRYVCTTFVDEVLRRAGYSVDSGQVNINLDYLKLTGKAKSTDAEKKAIIKELVERDDPKIQGMVTALVNSGQGVAINIKDVQPGDLVQYWDGSVSGHAVIVKKPLPQPDGSLRIIFHGSHKGLGGVGELEKRVLDAGGKERTGTKFYAVRPIHKG